MSSAPTSQEDPSAEEVGGDESAENDRDDAEEPTSTGTAAGETTRLNRDAFFDVLTNKRKRYVFHALKQRDGHVDVGELAEQVAAWENEKEIDDLDSKERKRVYVSLYQSHLDSMAASGIVDYDRDAGRVALTPDAAEATVYMEIVPGSDIAWRWFYVGLAAVGAVVLGLATVGFPPFSEVPPLGWAWIVLLVFGVAAIVEALTERRMQFGDEGPPPELAGS